MTLVMSTVAALSAFGFLYLLQRIWQHYFISPIYFDPSTRTFHVRGLPYFGSIQFAFDPYEYLHSIRTRLPSGEWFRIRFSGRTLVIPSGAEAAKFILFNKAFSFKQGYAVLAPGLLNLFPKNRSGNPNHESAGYVVRRFMRTEKLQSYLHPILGAIQEGMKDFKSQGSFDPVLSYSELVFQIGLRITLGNEVANDPTTVKSTAEAFRWLNDAAHPHGLVMPLVPTPTRIRCILACIRLWRLVNRLVGNRSADGNSTEDMLQVLLDEGADIPTCVEMTIMMMFASSSTVSITLIWLHVYILQNPVWHDRVRAEIDAFVRTHHVGAIPQPGGILAESLGDVPLSAWDGNLPILDMCIQETVRLVADGVLPRRLAGTDPVQLNGRTILPGDFVLVPTQPHNLDPELHDDPLEFRPDRDLTRANSAVLGNLAWGAGPHACPGQRFARHTLKLVTVLMWFQYDFAVTDTHGSPYEGIPNRENHLFSIGAPKEDVRLRYSARSGKL